MYTPNSYSSTGRGCKFGCPFCGKEHIYSHDGHGDGEVKLDVCEKMKKHLMGTIGNSLIELKELHGILLASGYKHQFQVALNHNSKYNDKDNND